MVFQLKWCVLNLAESVISKYLERIVSQNWCKKNAIYCGEN